jgi:phosphocarrier protein
MMLGAGPGSTITVQASGKDATAVMDAIESLIGGRFDEDD